MDRTPNLPKFFSVMLLDKVHSSTSIWNSVYIPKLVTLIPSCNTRQVWQQDSDAQQKEVLGGFTYTK